MNTQEKIAFFEGEEKRLEDKAKQCVAKGLVDSARMTIRLATGIKKTLANLRSK